MPPRLSNEVTDPLNPAEAGMGQTSNGSNKRPREEEDDDVDDDEEEGGKKERKIIPAFKRICAFTLADDCGVRSKD